MTDKIGFMRGFAYIWVAKRHANNLKIMPYMNKKQFESELKSILRYKSNDEQAS